MTSSERSPNRLSPADCSSASRSARVVMRIGSTTLIPVWLDDGAVVGLGHGGLLYRIYQLSRPRGQERGSDGNCQRFCSGCAGLSPQP